jgi:hypothetical protein
MCGLYGAGQAEAAEVKLLEYAVSSVTAGIDALGEVTVRLLVSENNAYTHKYIHTYIDALGEVTVRLLVSEKNSWKSKYTRIVC